MKKLFGFIIVLCYLNAWSTLSWAGDVSYSGGGESTYELKSSKCPDSGGDNQTVVIIPRVYISYVGKYNCWSEIREVEIPVDFLRLHDIAKANGDAHTTGLLSHGNLPDFFTWLLESGEYTMPGDALFGILGYVQRNDYAGLYRLYRLFGASRHPDRSR